MSGSLEGASGSGSSPVPLCQSWDTGLEAASASGVSRPGAFFATFEAGPRSFLSVLVDGRFVACSCCCYVAAVVSDPVQPHRRQPTRLPRPWDSPDKNTGVGCHFLLQCMRVKSESEVAQSCPTLFEPMDCSTLGFRVHHQLPGLALKESQHPPFLTGSSLYSAKEKFSEGMVNFYPVAES